MLDFLQNKEYIAGEMQNKRNNQIIISIKRLAFSVHDKNAIIAHMQLARHWCTQIGQYMR